MLKRRVAQTLLTLMPSEWKKTASIYLGAPHVQWSLGQLKRFGFEPCHVLDVGAFQGKWARTCAAVFPQVQITCVEPQDELQSKLRELASQLPNMQVIQTLLGRAVLPSVPFAEAGSGSSVFGQTRDPSVSRPMLTIDALIKSGRCHPPNLIKLDVQGYEIEVLEGWTRGFDQCEVIQCEVSLLPLVPEGPLLNELIAYLGRRGFVMFDVTELIRAPSDGAVWQIDSLFCRIDSPLYRERKWRL